MTAQTVNYPAIDDEAPLRLLLIEDSTADSELVLALIEDGLPRASVAVVATLEDALAELDRHDYDATLADLSLPDADGLAVVRAVRAAHPATALLVHTSRVDGRLALWALAEGAQDYLVKGEQDGAHLAVSLLHALQRQRAEQETHRYLQLARGLLDALEAPTCAVDGEGVIIAANTSWGELVESTGGSAAECGEGSQYVAVCGVAMGTGGSAAVEDVVRGLRAVLGRRVDRFQLEYPCRTAGAAERWFSVRISPADRDGGFGAVVSHVDVTAMRVVQEELSRQALHDPLTGLPNRLLLSDRLGQALADAARHGSLVGVGFLDLDHFKRVNDSLGHSAGDELLTLVAARLEAGLRAGDTLARYAGDEFVVVWRDLAARADVELLVDRLGRSLDEPFQLGSTSVTVTASVGVVIGVAPQTVEDLLADADSAMYDAKTHARGRARVFTDEMRRDAAARMRTEVQLRAALQNDELVLHYQPVVDLGSGKVVGFEALVRWQHPERGLLGPGEFIPIAEASGLIVPLGRWVLERACVDAAAFEGPAAYEMAVNLSAFELTQPDVIKNVQDALRFSGLDPARLLLEVTESALMEDEEAAALALDELSRLGVRVAIDDFGTGYSSLLYLRRYPIKAIKLDRAFVGGIGSSADDEAICKSVVSLAKAVSAVSIGEGVETEEQYAALRSYGCRLAQGYLWSPAVGLDDLAAAVVRCEALPVPEPVSRRRKAGAVIDAATTERIRSLYADGASLHTIAAVLNQEPVPCPTGRKWSATSVALLYSNVGAAAAKERDRAAAEQL